MNPEKTDYMKERMRPLPDYAGSENTPGIISDIQKFSLHDGPGIRTTVFFKGCPLHCVWCHNPESIKFERQIVFNQTRCIGCNLCYKVCKSGALGFDFGARSFNKDMCTCCGSCVSVCPGDALYWVGMEMTAREIFNILASDIPYYQNSGGGVTISGGEPLAQAEFLAALLRLCKDADIHTAIETGLFAFFETIEKILSYVDLFYCDLKLIDSKKHEQFTGFPNERILENLKRLYGLGKPVIIRTPLIPGFSATEENIRGIAEWLKQNTPLVSYELLNYNPLARSKWENLNITYEPGNLKPLKEKDLKDLAEAAEAAGIKTQYRRE
jgi:pyruvate formate lyase activating enzyme